MKIDTVVTLDNNHKYYLIDETTHEGNKYFLANELDAEDDVTENSFVLKEIQEGDTFILEEVTEEKLLNYITAIFTTKMINLVEKEESEGEI